ncbi:MAG TPA: flippase [Candidatus Saccharimonadia bacterium]|nr:flippase [Candidatus Saccharimonadia bacterium]
MSEGNIIAEVALPPPRRNWLVLKNMGWLTFQKVFVIIIGVITTGWVARKLGPEQVGVLATAQALVMYFGVVGMGVDMGVFTKRLLERPEQEAGIMGGTVALLAVTGVLSWLALGVFLWTADVGADVVKFATLVFGLKLLFSFPTVISGWFQSRQRLQYMVIPNTAGSLGSRVWQFVFAGIGAGVVWVAAAEAAGLIIIITWYVILYIKCGESLKTWKVDWRAGWEVLRDSLPLMINACLMALMSRMDVLMLRAYHGEAAAGYFSAAIMFTESLFFLNTLLSVPLLPVLVLLRKNAPERYESARLAYARLSAALGWMCAIGLSLGSGIAVGIVYGVDYAPSVSILAVHALLLVPCYLGGSGSCFLTMENLLKWQPIFLLLGFATNFSLNLHLIPKYGAQGAAWASVCGVTVSAVLAPMLFNKTRNIGRTLAKALVYPVPNLRELPMQGK